MRRFAAAPQDLPGYSLGWGSTIGQQILPSVVHPGATDMNTPVYSPTQYNALKDQMTQYAVYAGLGGLAVGALAVWYFKKR